eukprot:CAMPEP_0116127798 /NCGR_PEP_ID=MMETSP0329-20121206/7025_1 /TAXON_ID=697910 /ORGANISM="Pseudo-nitzschia arenysensis, Strain B593" /LENGTH=522 /DNA_ID=CAMNT_0003621907 /DNA_START=5 /DNA_END=1577 /DNA_ORIENTATION=+
MKGIKRLDLRKSEILRGTNSQCSRPDRDSVKRCFLLLLNIAAISTSVLTIYSCKFFSYKEVDVFNDEYTSDADLSYEPFEYLPSAGVGLFSYYMGDPTGKGVMMNDQMCFYYCDEFTDYQWLSSNNKEAGGVDKWVLARYCSIFAPIFGLLAFLQIFVETISRYQIPYCGSGIIIKTQLFLCAAFFQIGTFSVVLAPPIMYSTSIEDLQQQFCFSGESNVRCKMDTGSIFSLTSIIIYLLLAHSSFYTRRPSMNTTNNNAKGGIERDTDESSISDISESNSESQSENHSKLQFKHSLSAEQLQMGFSMEQMQSVSASEDEASVFNTLIQYFGRNKSGDLQDETLVESDLDLRIGQSIDAGIEELKLDDHTRNGVDSSSLGDDQNATDTVSDTHENNHPGSTTTSSTTTTSTAGSGTKKAKWGKIVTNFNARSAGGESRRKRNRKNKSDDIHNKTSDQNEDTDEDKDKSSKWETESSNSLLELGIKLNPMTPYSASRSYTSDYNSQNNTMVEEESLWRKKPTT